MDDDRKSRIRSFEAKVRHYNGNKRNWYIDRIDRLQEGQQLVTPSFLRKLFGEEQSQSDFKSDDELFERLKDDDWREYISHMRDNIDRPIDAYMADSEFLQTESEELKEDLQSNSTITDYNIRYARQTLTIHGLNYHYALNDALDRLQKRLQNYETGKRKQDKLQKKGLVKDSTEQNFHKEVAYLTNEETREFYRDAETHLENGQVIDTNDDDTDFADEMEFSLDREMIYSTARNPNWRDYINMVRKHISKKINSYSKKSEWLEKMNDALGKPYSPGTVLRARRTLVLEATNYQHARYDALARLENALFEAEKSKSVPVPTVCS